MGVIYKELKNNAEKVDFVIKVEKTKYLEVSRQQQPEMQVLHLSNDQFNTSHL